MQQVTNGPCDARTTPVDAGCYVPPESSVISQEVLAQVFKDKRLPFTTNADGSVDLSIYMQWLELVGVAALQAFEECSDTEYPNISGEVTDKVL